MFCDVLENSLHYVKHSIYNSIESKDKIYEKIV